MATKLRIGWIGTGVMGRSMCSHLLKAGYECTVYNRTKSKADSLLEQGAIWADSPALVAQASDVVFSIVGFPKDVEEVLLGDSGAIANMDSNGAKIVVDMTTSSPRLAAEMADFGRDRGVAVLDAPVSGGDVGARNAKLSIMVGGDEQAFEFVKPLLSLMGTNIVRHGEAGMGQRSKMVNQILIAGTMLGLAEAFRYARHAGLDMTAVMQSVESGAAGSWSLSNYGPRVLKGDFAPGFYIDHFVKDLGLALQEAARMNIDLSTVALANQEYQKAQEQGLGKNGTQAICKLE